MKKELRFVEVRAQGNILEGTCITYGEITKIGPTRERFMPGAFGDLSGADICLNVHHDRARPLTRSGSGLVLIDSLEKLEMKATLPQTREAEDARILVENGVLRGLSIEFASRRESVVDRNIRQISKAVLLGLGIVPYPQYIGSTVEARGEALAAVMGDAIGDEDPARIVEDMALSAGVSTSTVRQILAGEISLPPRSRLVEFAEVLGIPARRLFDAAIEDGGSPEEYRRKRLWI